MLRATWRAGSLRFWVFVGMALAVLPLLASAVAGYFVLHKGLVADFQDVARRQHDQITPNQELRLDLWEATNPIDLYLDDSQPSELADYRAARERIEAGFAQVHQALMAEPEAGLLVERARADWTDADHVATQILATRWPAGSANGVELAKRFESSIAAAIDRLEAVHDDLMRDITADRLDADRSYERSEWIAGVAAVASLVLVCAGVFIIGRFLLASVDRLVDGAAKFAAGDRDHRIEVHVPPELSRVAEEFNHMISRIRENESELADLARRDRLTGVLNRRALDDELRTAMARRRRLNEDVGLVLIDIDHFKRINDTYGHPAGDEVLRNVAAELTSCVREIDKVFRMGGEEFVLLLNGADRVASLATAERARQAIAARPVPVDGRLIPVTVSAGVVIATDTHDTGSLMAAADAALYRAKQEGRNRVLWAGESGTGD